jgi:peptidoglycan hydrolase-like protein with peptidoglycan-binding domain
VPDPGPGAGLLDLPVSIDTASAGSVTLAQALLNAAGPGAGLALDGILGPLTSAGLAAFREAQGLAADAALDLETWSRLLAFSSFATLAPGTGAEPMSGPPVGTVQDLLGFSGLVEQVPITSSFDPATATAVESFQTAVGLTPTGVVDQPTWRALEALTTDLAPRGLLETSWSFDASAETQVAFVSARQSGGPVPSTDLLDNMSGATGWWVEWRDQAERRRWRRLLHDPFRLVAEVPGDPAGVGDFTPLPPATSGAALILVPDVPLGDVLAIFGSPDGGAATELGRVTRAQLETP